MKLIVGHTEAQKIVGHIEAQKIVGHRIPTGKGGCERERTWRKDERIKSYKHQEKQPNTCKDCTYRSGIDILFRNCNQQQHLLEPAYGTHCTWKGQTCSLRKNTKTCIMCSSPASKKQFASASMIYGTTKTQCSLTRLFTSQNHKGKHPLHPWP